MRSIFSKLAVAAFITIGFITQETQSVQIRNLVHAQRQDAHSSPNMFAEVLLGAVTVPASTTTPPSKDAKDSKDAPKVTSGTANPQPPAKTTTTTTTPAATT